MLKGLWSLRWREVLQEIYRLRVPAGVRLLNGPTLPPVTCDDLIVVCLVKDGQAHVSAFLEHHFSLGARHIVLLDNDSSDGTVEQAHKYDRVTILQTSLSFKKYKDALRAYLFERFGRLCWCLIADIDERFAYPMSDQVTFAAFLGYLKHEGYTAVVAQLLDLFAEGPVDSWPVNGDAMRESCRWYDNTELVRKPYLREAGNRISNEAIHYHWGGIRKAVFGVNAWLTKHPLLYWPGGARPIGCHRCRNARVADLSCLLLHYKFDRSFREKSVLAVRRGNYWRSSYEYKCYLSKLFSGEKLTLKRSSARKWTGTNQLLAENFLVVSEKYRDYVRRLNPEKVANE